MSSLGSRLRDGGWLVVPLLTPLLVGLEAARLGRVLAPGDGLTYYLPVHVLAARSWRHGALPSWDPWSFSGSPLFATSQVGALYPPNLVHLVVSPVAAHNALVVLAYAVAGTGAALLGRRLTGDRVAGAACGVAFGSSGFLFGHLSHLSLIATAAWLPWSVWGLERYLARPTPLRLLAGAAPITAAALAGHPQLLVVVVTITGLWGAGVAVGRQAVAVALRTATPIVTGLLLGAVQLVPVAAHVGVSDRSSLAFAEVMTYSFSPSSLLLTVFPMLLGNEGGAGPFDAPYTGEWSLTELAGYAGASAIVLAAVGLRSIRRAEHLPAVALVAVVSLLVALGDSTPFGRVVHALPVVGQMRSWSRAAVGLDLVVAVLAAHGVATVRRGGATGRTAAVTAACIAALGALAWVHPDRAPDGHAAWAIGLPVAAAALGALALRLPRSVAGLAVVVLVGVDLLLSFGWWHRWRATSPDAAVVAAALAPGAVPQWGPVPDAPGGIERVAFAFEEPLRARPDVPRLTGAQGVRTVAGYDPLAPGDYLAVVGVSYRGVVHPSASVLDAASPVADLLRVTWVVDARLDGHPRQPGLPEAFLVGRARNVSHREAVSAARGDVPLVPSAVALVEGCDPCRAARRPGPAGTVEPVQWGAASAEVRVEADRDAVLVVSQAWAPGWSASVDGRPAPVVRAYGLVQAVPVPAGRHRVVLRYEPPGLRTGAVLSAGTLGALATAAAVHAVRRRPAPSR